MGCLGGGEEKAVAQLHDSRFSPQPLVWLPESSNMSVFLGGKSVGDHVLVTELVTYWLVRAGRLYKVWEGFNKLPQHYTLLVKLPAGSCLRPPQTNSVT